MCRLCVRQGELSRILIWKQEKDILIRDYAQKIGRLRLFSNTLVYPSHSFWKLEENIVMINTCWMEKRRFLIPFLHFNNYYIFFKKGALIGSLLNFNQRMSLYTIIVVRKWKFGLKKTLINSNSTTNYSRKTCTRAWSNNNNMFKAFN